MDPIIHHFDFIDKVVKRGSATTVKWEVTDGSKIFIRYEGLEYRCTGRSEWTFYHKSVDECELIVYGTDDSTVVRGKAFCKIIDPVRVNLFDISPKTLLESRTATLRWDISGATQIILYPDNTSLPASGVLILSPAKSCNYILEARNELDITPVRRLSFVHVEPLPKIDPIPLPAMPTLNMFDENWNRFLNAKTLDTQLSDNLFEEVLFTQQSSPFYDDETY